MAAGPAFGIAALGIVWIGDDVEELCIAGDATDVFEWPGAGAVDAAGGARCRIEGEEPLELDDVLPVVAKVVDVEKAEAFAAADVEEAHLALVETAGVVLELGLAELGVTIGQAADAELVQVVVPASRRRPG